MKLFTKIENLKYMKFEFFSKSNNLIEISNFLYISNSLISFFFNLNTSLMDFLLPIT